MNKRLVVFAAFLFALITTNGQTKLVEKVTKQGTELVIPYEKYVLPNGLTLIIHEDHSDPVVYVDVTYHVGSAREEIGKSGFAHFFEHMMFQGSDHVGDEQHFKIVSDAGGTLNGSTNRDRTNYFQTVPSNQLEKMLWLEADRMGFLLDAVTQKKFEIQRSTVKNEKGQNYENVPYRGALETQYKTIYPYGHPYSWLTIGYVEDLNRVDVKDLKNFFLRWYGPNNATITVSGDVKPADVVKLSEKYFGVIPRGPEVNPVVLPSVQIDKDRYVSYFDNYAKTPQLSFTYSTVPVYSREMAALQCLSQVIGQGRNSVLYQQFVKKRIAQSATAFSSLTELAGEFSMSISPMPGKDLAEIEKLYRAALDSFEARGVTEEDVVKFRGQQEAQLINGLQSVQGKGANLAQYQTLTGNPNKITELLKMYSSLSKEDVMAVYQKYIKGKGAVILSIVPKGQETMIAAANNFKVDSSIYTAPDYGYAGLKYAKAKDNFDRSRIPAAGPNPTVKVPAFWKKDLPNGVKVIGTMNTEIPTVTFSLSIPGGHLLSSGDKSKVGLSGFFADMMGEDTKNYTAEQLAVELQKLGSTINVSSSVDAIDFTVQSLKKNFDKTLELLQERIFNPKFSQQSFDRLQAQAAQFFRQQKGQPATIASNVFAKVNYGPNHILGMSEDGTPESVKNIKLEDIGNYYTNYMTSMDAKVVVVGDITEKEVLSKLGFLDKLPKKKIALPKVETAQAVDKTKVYMVDIPKGAQTEFRVGYSTGLTYNATGDYYKSVLMNYPLGGNFNSRLNLNLREDKGWTYGARSGFSGDEYSGDFQFSSGIRADATDSALSEVMREIKEYSLQGPSDEELTFMKNAIGQNDALRYETGIQKANFIRRILDYNLPANYVDQQNKILKSMTKEQMKEMAKKYLNPDKMNILLVGDRAKIYDGVKKLGYEVIELDTDGKKVEKKGF